MDHKDYLAQQKVETDHFWYIARKQLIDRLLAAVYGQQTGARQILDIGCGTGTELPVLAKYGKVVGLDNNIDALGMVAARGFATVMCDLENEQLPAASYDAVCAFDVLEHVDDDGRLMGEIFNSLKPGGYFIFTVPAFPWLFSSHDEAMGHFRRYSQVAIKKQLAAASFRSVKIGYWNVWLFLPVAIMRLVKRYLPRGQKAPQTEASNLPQRVNAFLRVVLNSEKHIFNASWLPFGLTIYGIVQKYED